VRVKRCTGKRVIFLDTAFKVGEIVRSTAGRDKGSYYLVIDNESKNKLKVVDGVKRKFNNPKYKNSKHIESTGEISEQFLSWLNSKKRVRSEDVRLVLKDYLSKEEVK
jgi:ribosomal protein L14E/L6E/L27E